MTVETWLAIAAGANTIAAVLNFYAWRRNRAAAERAAELVAAAQELYASEEQVIEAAREVVLEGMRERAAEQEEGTS